MPYFFFFFSHFNFYLVSDCFIILFQVKIIKMHGYTIIQIVAIALIWCVKEFATLAFPFALLSMIAVHALLKRFYSADEITAVSIFVPFCNCPVSYSFGQSYN